MPDRICDIELNETDSENKNNLKDISEISTDFDTTDPYCWPTFIRNSIRTIIVQKGPTQIQNIIFLVDENGRSFSIS